MKFKFPSIAVIIDSAAISLSRFPFVMISSFIGAFCHLYIVEHNGDDVWMGKLSMVCLLGIGWFTALALFAESKKIKAWKKLLINLFGALLLGFYFYFLPELKLFRVVDYSRYGLFFIAIHMLVAFAPYIGKGFGNGFWQFNLALFSRVCSAALYAGVLYIGLVLAIAAVNQLFDLNVNEKRYFELFIIMGWIFNVWFFLSGLPDDYQELEDNTHYPESVKVFTQYVLLPLVTIYLVILYAYLIKIIYQWELPKGWVAYLVIGFSVAGILALLFVWPIREKEGNTWIKSYAKWFYLAIYPLIILLGVAIYQRVRQYGITENRYFIIALALWLFSVATYFLFSRSKNIKLIPVSLCLLALFCSFGPWGAFAISENSQLARLKKILIKNAVLVNNKITKNHKELSLKDRREVTETLRYLNTNHGLKSIQSWFGKTDFSFDEIRKYDYRLGEVMTLMNIEMASDYYPVAASTSQKNFVLRADYYSTNALSVKGFDYMFEGLDFSRASERQLKYELDNDTLEIDCDLADRLTIIKNNTEIYSVNTVALVNRLIKEKKITLTNDYSFSLPKEKMTLIDTQQKATVKFIFSTISGVEENGKRKVSSFNCTVFVKGN